MSALLLILIPLVASLAIALSPTALSRWIALAGTLVLLAHAVITALFFGAWGGPGFAIEATWPLLPQFGVNLSLGADSVSMVLILLNALLMPLCIWGSFTAIADRQREYYAWMLALAAAVSGVFLARDLIVFYVCFEFTLVPLYFLIAIWGGDDREHAALKFFLYTFTGSLITLAGVLYVAWQYMLWRQAGAPMAGLEGLSGLGEVAGGQIAAWTFDIEALTRLAASELTPRQQGFVLLALLAGFAVKVPLFPVHTWLPLAHTQAPTAGSVLLAGILLKLGTYGIYRFVLPMVPDAVVEYAPFLAVLCIIGILYAALICWVQDDLKRLIAYSSVSHLGYCVLGLVALNPLGLQGAVLYMINHGLSTGALFLCVGMIYERFHTRDMDLMNGMAWRMPIWSFFLVFFTFASVGLPGLNGFVSEFLCLIGAFTATPDAPTGHPGRLGPWFALPAAAGMIFGAMYLLIMVGKVTFGPLRVPEVHHAVSGAHDSAGSHSALPVDLSAREIIILTPLAILCLVIGLQPRIVIDAVAGSVDATLAPYAVPVSASGAENASRDDAALEHAEAGVAWGGAIGASDGASASHDPARWSLQGASEDASESAATPAERTAALLPAPSQASGL